MITWIKRLIITATFLALIATNVLTLTHTAFNAAVSGLMGTYLGVRTLSSMMQSKLTSKNAAILKRKAATRRFGTRPSPSGVIGISFPAHGVVPPLAGSH